ncbi:hypothetical protein [Streptomyces chartreusis]
MPTESPPPFADRAAVNQSGGALARGTLFDGQRLTAAPTAVT